MFMCQPCNDEDDTCRQGQDHMVKSYGPCEMCGKIANCVDCKCYHYFPPKNADAATVTHWYRLHPDLARQRGIR